jgi:hypothetical protein
MFKKNKKNIMRSTLMRNVTEVNPASVIYNLNTYLQNDFDQSNDSNTYKDIVSAGTIRNWQSFQPGIMGSIYAIEWKMSSPVNESVKVGVELYEGEGDKEIGSGQIRKLLGISRVSYTPATSERSWVRFSFNTSIPLIKDTPYTMVLTTEKVSYSWLPLTVNNNYTRGKADIEADVGRDYDYFFRTYMNDFDQSNDSNNYKDFEYVGYAGRARNWQSFQPGITGSIYAIEWKMSSPIAESVKVGVELYEGEGDKEIGSGQFGKSLGKSRMLDIPVTYGASNTPWVRFIFDTPIPLVKDTPYTMVFIKEKFSYSWYVYLPITVNNNYTRGKSDIKDEGRDYFFRTYMQI